MTILEDARAVVRVTSELYNPEIQMLIDAALADLRRVGIREHLLAEETMDPLVRHAVLAYVKANFGFDFTEYELPQLQLVYPSIVASLLNSTANIATDFDETQYPLPGTSGDAGESGDGENQDPSEPDDPEDEGGEDDDDEDEVQ